MTNPAEASPTNADIIASLSRVSYHNPPNADKKDDTVSPISQDEALQIYRETLAEIALLEAARQQAEEERELASRQTETQ